MKGILERSAASQERIEIIYMNKKGAISQRMIRVLAVSERTVHAYCYSKKECRTFHIDNILSMAPVRKKQTYVI